MFISIRYKLFGTLLAAVILVVVGMFVLIHLSFGRGFLNYVNTEESRRLDSLAMHLQEAYAEEGDWRFLAANLPLWRRFLAASTPDGPQQFDPMASDRPAREDRKERRSLRPGHKMHQMKKHPRHLSKELKHLFEFRVVLLDADKAVVVGPRKIPFADINTVSLKDGSKTIGYLGHLPLKNLLSQHQLQFVQEQKKSFAIIAALIAALATLMAFPLARMLLNRMNALAGATHKLAAGKFATRLAVGPADELGQLTQDFNALALTLEKNEQGRRQWLADISHELRTPLSVLRGEIEALEDGVRALTPESLRSLHSEVMRLNRLVDDLFQLSMSDIGALTYRKEQVDLASLLEQAAELFRSKFAEKGIVLTLSIPKGMKSIIFADSQRLQQLFANLLNNSLKYTDSGGTLAVSCQPVASGIEILFQDSYPGVPVSGIPRLFERLYRVEGSRNRGSGGAGLGLAICRNIVEAHAGTIAAEASPLGGLLMRITFPLGENR